MKHIYIPILTLALAALLQALSAQKAPPKSEQPQPKKTYTQAQILEIVYQSIQNGLDKNNKIKLTPQTRFVNDLGYDSLDVVEFIMNMEKAFNIRIPDQQAEKVKTIQDAVQIIEALLRK